VGGAVIALSHSQKGDIEHLLRQPQFVRFLWFAVIQSSGIFQIATDGSNAGTSQQGRRNLGLEILEMVEAGQTIPHPDGLPGMTLFQVLREEANKQPQEKQNAKRSDRYSEMDDPADTA
jgi:hypothetical protein